MVLEYNEEIEQLLESAQMEVVEALKIRQDVFEQSIVALMENGYVQQFFLLQAGMRQKIK